MNQTDAINAGIPALGTWTLYAFLLSAAAAFALSVFATQTRSHTSDRYLRAARMAVLGTCALIAFDVLLLAYAFVSHDFRIRYVMRYSDRSMEGIYLLTALWGGQDGSLLWWTFLLSLYTGACTIWLKGRYRELTPYVLATLMVIVMFFGVLMAFAANPFAVNVAGAPPDGEGLNPSLRNFYMAIHPPSLYIGFVGCSVPFAFAIAALASGRLDEAWLAAVRKWALFSWLFLSIGNVLGMLWAYEELGWGGYWAWDPVENAACMPWFTATAFLHSIMIQERRGTLRVWNVSLIITTFLLTIFGTFLTRSGLIASIHSFAQSEVGVYFLYFMAAAIAVSVSLIALRWKSLRRPATVDALLSREAAFVVNNWFLLGICTFIVVATTWPKISEVMSGERLTVGAAFYNFWLLIPGLTLLALMGVGTLTPWRKGSPKQIMDSFRWPVVAGLVVGITHAIAGKSIGFPAVVIVDPIYPSAVGKVIAWLDGHSPAVGTGVIAFNLVALVQEFVLGARARVRQKDESALKALVTLVARNRRRYGGYIVHVGITLMFLGFLGGFYKSEGEASLSPGETFTVASYTLRYDGVESRREPSRREVYAKLTVLRGGREWRRVAPAKFIYTTHPDMPTSEVSIVTGLQEDLYTVMASVNATTRVAHIKAFVTPLVAWIWIGAIILILGTAVGMWPEVSEATRTARERAKARVGSAGSDLGADEGEGAMQSPGVVAARNAPTALVTLLALGALTLLYPARANAQGHTTSSPPPVGGNNEQMTPRERRVFDQLLCMCGDCARLPLATCTCDFAARTRSDMREKLEQNEPTDQIIAAYVRRYGAAALSVPPDEGRNRLVYAGPIAVLTITAGFGVRMVRRWRVRGAAVPVANAGQGAEISETSADAATRADYDRRLDEELRDLDQ
ncbi:MAG: cytochrome c-type biogenesis CcmF C-terminal domain-containing protein [Deltaproteobacteria bacterium]|nr:cytochrome c-type biogenesis CcmF C-terminal domain-containing protein [Deltaproteobacteria bacterium]